MTNPQSDYDNPWKEALEQYFEAFLAFFFPQAHAEIDWQRQYESLDQELRQVVREAEVGKRFVDKLVKVWQRNGEEAWVLIHVEVQSQEDANFAKRMYTYHYRIFDRYNRQVVSLAVLGDENPTWRPQAYGYELWGCRASLQFPTVKLLDYQGQWSALEASDNPFALLVMAHLRTQATRQNLEDRLGWKLRLVTGLMEAGYSEDKVLELRRLIDWMMALPKQLELVFNSEIQRYQEQRIMPYVTSFERFAIAKTQRDNIIEILETRFEAVSPELIEDLHKIYNIEILKRLFKQVITISSIEAFQQAVAQGKVEDAEEEFRESY
jgi:hypothetical protein